MAQLPESKLQNQAFLQEMERQRLHKPCNRIIDLRGKVTGECQAYQFGERTHYLDDRGYLLAKQLLARFNGQYTVGVYEALLRAIKQLKQNESTVQVVDNNKPKTIKLDRSLLRSEQRVIYSTAVTIRIDDVLYHGHTIDISPSAMRVSLKRSYSLNRGDIITLELVEAYEREGLPFLQKLTFQIIKIDQTDDKTTLVLSLKSPIDETLTTWLQNWVRDCAAHKSVDVDDQIDSQLRDCYLALWMKKFGSPVLWLGKQSSDRPLNFSHSSVVAAAIMDNLDSTSALSTIRLLLSGLANHPGKQCIAVITHDKFWIAPMEQPADCIRLLSWSQQIGHGQVLLLSCHPLHFDTSLYAKQISDIRAVDDSLASELEQQLSEIGAYTQVQDISLLCKGLPFNISVAEAQLSDFQIVNETLKAQLPRPKPLTPQISRKKGRFYIHTPVTVHVNGQSFPLETEDVSAEGLALKLPESVHVQLNQRISIDFLRWQTLTKKVDLSQVPYLVKNKMNWGTSSSIGLQRITANCPENLNQFFDDVIAKNEASLRQNHHDIIDALESAIFIDILKPSLTTIPVFLGMDESGQRNIETVAETDANHAENLPPAFWETLKTQLTRLTEQLKDITSKSASFGHTNLYAYLDQYDQWQFELEQSFSGAQHKVMFIQRALKAKQCHIYHAVIVPLSPLELAEDNDLAASFLYWHSQRPNRVKQIRRQLNTLFGILELTDITDFVRRCYQPLR